MKNRLLGREGWGGRSPVKDSALSVSQGTERYGSQLKTGLLKIIPSRCVHRFLHQNDLCETHTT
ncbi:hypothetical protein GZ78_09635 [Endozoicomonas numazuensis]|uniref:Uncharacterized protein n=1 Tax=Endozoicomonas numazuensis TaxID=1137799 RepID=A0A081NHG8_9GAMM|nr:hypothetical protein GZ78_09635 [Endozoicomonas numazuensis]